MGYSHFLVSLPIMLLISTALATALVLRFNDAATHAPVILVGTMHYNPHSIALTEATIRREAEAPSGVHSVCIELCTSRWNTTNARRWSRDRSLRRLAYEDEFQVAFEAAEDNGISLVLADQRIEETARRVAQLTVQSLRELASPAGWRAIASDLSSAAAQLRAGQEGIPLLAYLGPQLIAGAPLALIRYPIASPTASALLAAISATWKPLLAFLESDAATVVSAPECAPPPLVPVARVRGSSLLQTCFAMWMCHSMCLSHTCHTQA